MFNGHPQITFVISVLRLFLFWLLLFLLPVFLSSLTQTVPHSAKIGFILMQQLCHILPAVMQGEPVIFFAKFYGQGNNKLTNKAAVFRFFGFFHSIPYIRIANESVIAPDYVLNQLILKGMNRTCDELSSEYDFKNYAFSKLRERYKVWAL